MSSRNRLLVSNDEPSSTTSDHKHPRSLRSQLVLWYGGLIVASLGTFVLLVLWLATNAIHQSADQAIETEVRIATIDIGQKLSPDAPYWPATLLLTGVNVYKEPGIAIAVIDTQGTTRYHSTGNIASIPQDKAAIRTAQATNTPQWYIQLVNGERVKVKAVAIHAPQGGPVVGTLLVAKSLTEVDKTIFLLHTLLILVGLISLTIALIGAWAMTTNVLRPLAEIVKTARAIAANTRGNLSQRVRRPRGQDEMAQVVDTFNEMLAALERTTQTQRRFIADASHELRAPLTTVQGNLAFLLRHIDNLPPDERRTTLNDAYSETLRLARLVDELLLLARADAYADTTSSSPTSEVAAATTKESFVELDHALLQLVRQLRRRLSLEGSKLKLEIGHIEPARVCGDEENVRRVMLILIDNALKYTPVDDENAPGRVTVSLECTSEGAIFHVQDTGIGIDPADLPYIFDRFYRADRARSRQGAGLGLSIAQMIVEQLGGRITAQSLPGKGSTFSVWLPLA